MAVLPEPGGWIATGAAVQGTAHARSGLPCQDAALFRSLDGELLLVALADGAGSARWAEPGARRAAEAALDSLAETLAPGPPQAPAGWEAVLSGAFAAARAAIEDLALESGEPLQAFATTLTCAVASPAGLAVAQLGDGAVVARGEDGSLFTATRQQRGEYANETNFLTGECALEQVATQFHAGRIGALAVLSDGLTRLALQYPAGEPHAPFFRPLFAYLEVGQAGLTQPAAGAVAGNGDHRQAELAAFLGSERVNARTDDDKSLVLAIWNGVPLAEA